MTKAESKAAAVLGRKGGQSKSQAKAQASRDNGKLGGRPNTLQLKALKMLSYGVPMNLRHYFTAPTVAALIKRGLIVQASDKMEHAITEAGLAKVEAMDAAFGNVAK